MFTVAMARIRAGALLAPLLAAAIAAPAGASSFQDPSDFDLDGVRNAADTCLLVADGTNADADQDGVGDACDSLRPNPTVEALRSLSQRQVDELFATLQAGPMPAFGTAAQGYVTHPVRWLLRTLCPTCRTARDTDRFVSYIWQGKVWYTNPDGGHLYDRLVDGRRSWYHRVRYGTAKRDGRPAIIVEPVPGAELVYDTIRMVQPGIYLGFAFLRTYGVGRDQRLLNFTLDFTNPELSRAQCPLCAVTRRGLR